MPVLRSRARAAVLVAALVAAVAPVAAPAAHAVPTGVEAVLTGGGAGLVRGAAGQPYQLRVTNWTGTAYDVSLVPHLPAGVTLAGVEPALTLLPGHHTKVVTLTFDVAADVPPGQQEMSVDVVTADHTVPVDLTGPVVAPPDAPTGVTATAGDNSAAVTWSPGAANSFGPDEAGHVPGRTFVVTASPGGATEVVGAGATSATVRGLANGTAYTFTVLSHTSFGSATSAPSAPVTPAGVPGPVTGVAVTGSGGTRTVSWDAADGNGAAVTGYTVTASTGTTTAAAADATSAEVTGVDDTTSFTVRAANAVGEGFDSAPTDGAQGKPGEFAGTLAAAALATDGEVTGAGATVSDSGGSGVTAYDLELPDGTVLQRTRDAGASEPFGFAVPASAVTLGATLAFRVRAVNALGAGPWSAPTAPVATSGTPGDPAGARAFAADGKAYVSFLPTWHRGGPVTGYVVTADDGVSLEPLSWTLPATARGGWLTGLANGTAYALKVLARNAYGDSGPALWDVGGSSVTPEAAPAAPTAVTVTHGDGAASVGWAAAAGSGAYEVVASPGGARVVVAATPDATTESAALTGLANGTTYTFSVRAHNAYGVSAPATSAARTVGAPAQTSFSAVDATDATRALTMSWHPAAPNGSAVTGYTVTAAPGGKTYAFGGSTTTAKVVLPSWGTKYTFTVTATNAAGTGPASAPAGPYVRYDTSAPLVTANQPSTLITLTGTATMRYSAVDTGSGVQSYDVRYHVAWYADGGFGAYRYPAAWQRTTARSVSVAARDGWTYCFSVRARDVVGNVAPWSPDRCLAGPVDDRQLYRSPGWAKGTSASYYRGTYSATVTRGASIGKQMSGVRVVTVIGTRCSRCGKVLVVVNGKSLGVVDFWASRTRYRYQANVVLPRRVGGPVTLVAYDGRVYIDAIGFNRV